MPKGKTSWDEVKGSKRWQGPEDIERYPLRPLCLNPMSFKLSYSKIQLHEAAKFILANNRFVKQWPGIGEPTLANVEKRIFDTMMAGASRNKQYCIDEHQTGFCDHRWDSYNATGGCLFQYTLNNYSNDNVIDVDIYVNPAVAFDEREYCTLDI